jgi:hypothetical protein
MCSILRTFELVLPSATVDVMFKGVLMVAASAVLFGAIGALRAHFGVRLRRVWALLLAAVATGSIAAPLAIRGRGVPAAPETRTADAIGDVADVDDVTSRERSSRVAIFAIDAASLELITNATADGRLPNFGRLLDAGAVMHLATLHPTSAKCGPPRRRRPRRRTASDLASRVARPRWPNARLSTRAAARSCSRVRASLRERAAAFWSFVEEPHTSRVSSARPFWSMLSAEHPGGRCRMAPTQPAPAVPGIRERRTRARQTSAAIEDSSSVYPPDAFESWQAPIHAAGRRRRRPGCPRRRQRNAWPDRSNGDQIVRLDARDPPRSRRSAIRV